MTDERPSLFCFGAAADELRRREIDRIKAATIPTIDALRALSPDELRTEVSGMLERLGYIHHVTQPQLWISLEMFAVEGDGRLPGSEGVSDEAGEDMDHGVHGRPMA